MCNKSLKSPTDPPMTGVYIDNYIYTYIYVFIHVCVSYKQVTDHKMKLPAKFASKLLKVSDFSDRCDVLVCVHLLVCMYVCVCGLVCVCFSVCVRLTKRNWFDPTQRRWGRWGGEPGLGQMTHAVCTVFARTVAAAAGRLLTPATVVGRVAT